MKRKSVQWSLILLVVQACLTSPLNLRHDLSSKLRPIVLDCGLERESSIHPGWARGKRRRLSALIRGIGKSRLASALPTCSNGLQLFRLSA
ncbi:hypothetical protein EDC01DRAFT_58870 [Geopyxis carbonaria]|nr:hypothetical protein EDC01DRAFT_58870 [Geopyxis carbonaria]